MSFLVVACNMTSGSDFPVARLQPAVTYMRISVLSQHKYPVCPLRTSATEIDAPPSSIMHKNLSRHPGGDVDIIYN